MHRLLDEYLSDVASHLGGMPASRREEELREMRAHLQDTVDAHVERGVSEDEAVRNTMTQFGAASVIAQEAVSAWKRERTESRVSFWGAAGFYLAFDELISFLISGIINPTHHLPYSNAPGMAFVVMMLCVVSFLFAGAAIGALFPKRGMAGVVVGLTLVQAHWCVVVAINAVWPGAHPSPVYSAKLVSVIAVSFAARAAMTLFAAWAASRLRLSLSGRGRLARF